MYLVIGMVFLTDRHDEEDIIQQVMLMSDGTAWRFVSILVSRVVKNQVNFIMVGRQKSLMGMTERREKQRQILRPPHPYEGIDKEKQKRSPCLSSALSSTSHSRILRLLTVYITFRIESQGDKKSFKTKTGMI